MAKQKPQTGTTFPRQTAGMQAERANQAQAEAGKQIAQGGQSGQAPAGAQGGQSGQPSAGAPGGQQGHGAWRRSAC